MPVSTPLDATSGPIDLAPSDMPSDTPTDTPTIVLDEAPMTSVLDAPTNRAQGHWEGRPVLARLVRTVVFVLPVILSTAASWALSWTMPHAATTSTVIAQAAIVGGFALFVAWASRPLARRLLPLSALLELTLVFPDQAPSRMSTALRSRSEDELAALIEHTRLNGLPTDAVEAAQVILELVAELSRHDRITRGHSERVRAYASLIGQEMGMSADEVGRLGWAGLLHDIGKLTVSSEILNKPGKLTDDEYDVIKGHAAAGGTMVEPLRGWLGDVVDAVGQHHERWDGKGYPSRLQGDAISPAARILAVADVFDVITAQRSYKKASSPAEARQEIANCAGTQFDPKVVRAFLAISVGSFKVVRGPLAVLAQLPVMSSLALPAAVTPALGAAATATLVVGAAFTGPTSANWRSLEQPTPVAVEVDEGASVDRAPAAVVTEDDVATVADSTTSMGPHGEEQQSGRQAATAAPPNSPTPAEATSVPAQARPATPRDTPEDAAPVANTGPAEQPAPDAAPAAQPGKQPGGRAAGQPASGDSSPENTSDARVADVIDDPTSVIPPMVESVVEPVVEPLVETVVEPVVEPLVKTVVEPVVEPLVETVVEPVVEPLVETVVEPVVEPLVKTVVDPVVKTVVEPITETVVDPVVKTVVDGLLGGLGR